MSARIFFFYPYAASGPPPRRAFGRAAPRHQRDGPDLLGGGRDEGPHPGATHGALQHGRHPHKPPRRGKLFPRLGSSFHDTRVFFFASFSSRVSLAISPETCREADLARERSGSFPGVCAPRAVALEVLSPCGCVAMCSYQSLVL